MMGVPGMMNGGVYSFSIWGWIIELLAIGVVVYIAVKLALKNNK